MSREAINKMIGEAMVNKRFRAILLSNPGKVAGSFHLSPEELQLLLNMSADSLEELASQLYDAIRKRGRDHMQIGPTVLRSSKDRKTHSKSTSGSGEERKRL